MNDVAELLQKVVEANEKVSRAKTAVQEAEVSLDDAVEEASRLQQQFDVALVAYKKQAPPATLWATYDKN